VSDLIALTALGAQTPAQDSFGGITLRENPGLALASLAVRRGGQVPAPFGVVLPGPGGWNAGQGVSAFWIGPDQWMVEAEARAEEDFAAELKTLCPACSVTEQTDGWAAIEITADSAATIQSLLERLVNVNAADFGAGSATRTTLEHMGVYVIRRAPDHLAILGMRSLTGSLWHALATVAKRIKTETVT